MTFQDLKSLIRSDLARYQQTFRLRRDQGSRRRIALESFLFKPGFQAVFLFRLSHFFFARGWIYLAWLISRFNQFFTTAEMEFNAKVGPGLFISHPGALILGRGAVLGRQVVLFQGTTIGALDWHPERIGKFPHIGNNVFVFAGAKVLGNITLGNNVVVGANAVVVGNVPDGALAVGNPAVIKPGRGAEMIRSWGLELLD
jgi:serine O-acetyltransferase